MRVRNVTVGIKSLKQVAKEVIELVHNLEKGRRPKGPIRGTYFVSLEAMLKVLTPKRLELLRTIREKHPQSIYELAAMTHRHITNVQDDIDHLHRIDHVSLSRKSTARRRVIPAVNYDQLHL